MRWSNGVLGILFSVVVMTSPAAIGTSAATSTHPEGSDVSPLVTDAVPVPVASSPRELPAATPVSLTFTMSNPRSEQLNRFLTEVENPVSSSYRHFLTFPAYVSEFAPPVSSVAQVVTALTAAGATDITIAPDRSAVTAVLTATSVDQLLGIHLVSYGSVGRVPAYTAVGEASLPRSLTGLVSGVDGLSDAATAQLAAFSTAPSLRPMSFGGSQFVHDNTSGEDWFVGSDYAQVYGATELFPGTKSVPNATYPRSVAIATLLGSAYNDTTQTNLPPWDPAVIEAYFNATFAPTWPLPNLTGVPVTLNGVTPPLPGSYGALNDTTAYEYENSLDLEMAGSLAPGASIYNFYFAGSLVTGDVTVGDAANYLASDLANALSYNYAPAHLSVVSCSFGLPDLNNTAWNVELLTAAALGVTIISASGDQGNAPDSLTSRGDGQWPVWPATAASNTSGSISVGGVSLSLSGTPSAYYNGTPLNLSYDPTPGQISSVVAWYDTSGGQGAYAGTEGGASSEFPEPYWQFHSAAQPAVVNATVRQGSGHLGRSGPDVAMPGNSTLATVYANSTGVVFFDILEGTSVAAPVLAGLLADVVAVENNRSTGPWTSLGFVDPEIYRFASFFATHPAVSGNPFIDVTVGSNYVFSAAPGWDPTTGWGEVNAPAFLAADRNSTLLDYVYNGATPNLPPAPAPTPIPWTYIYAIFGTGIVVAILLVVFAARPSRRRPTSTGVPWGAATGGPAPLAPGPPRGPYPGATFLCPYCGALRPSEPVRCPRCGAY
jgi:subtilase family serine protease